MFIVIMLFMILNTYVFKPKPQPVAQDQTALTDSVKTTAQATQKTTEGGKPAAAVSDSLFQGSEVTKTLTLSNDLVTVKFSTLGASITSAELNKFKTTDKKHLVNLVPEGESLAGITLMGPNLGGDLKTLNWQYTKPTPDSLVFWLGEQAKPAVRKIFTLDKYYGIKMDVAILGDRPVNGIEYDFSAGIADSETIKPKTKDMDYKMLIFAENNLQKTTLAKIKKESPKGSFDAFKWVALRTKYFTLAVCETGNPLTRNYRATANPNTGNPAIVIDSYDRTPSPVWEQQFLIYIGPADHDIMKTYTGTRMELIPERGAGWLRWLSNAIAWLLKFLHSFIPNYGIVIIIFSIILKIVLHPLTHKSMDASLKMQRIQPKVAEIQKTYKSDPKTMQMELSKLYKEAGASPLSGCLPLLLQMPIFITLYTVLRFTIDMRNAYFMGWLKDLSEPDPLLILPIIMALFMILQSLMMRPSKEAFEQMDEKQKAMQQSTKMMTWLMPVMMFFIFKGLPSGLVLYYTVFNILSVAQQYYLQKHLKQKGI